MVEYDLGVFGERAGPWKILLTPNALKAMNKMAGDGNFKIAGAKLRSLAQGFWSDRMRGYGGDKVRVPLRSLMCDAPTRVIWQVDFGYDELVNAERQLIIIWDFGTYDDIDKVADKVAVIHSRYTEQHVACCNTRPSQDPDGSWIPWMPPPQDAEGGENGLQFVRADDRAILEVGNRFFNLTKGMIKSALANKLGSQYPFNFSQDETTITLHNTTPTLILGRSGTGKTTCLIYKLLARYLASRGDGNDRPLRPGLLTRSPHLAQTLDEDLQSLLANLSTDDVDQGDQVVRARGHAHLIDFIDVAAGSFPIVCDFDRFIDLLERIVIGFQNQRLAELGERHIDVEARFPQTASSKCVDLASFLNQYWPKLRNCLPSRVQKRTLFSELMGVIKGSLRSRLSLQPLSREEYLALGERVAPNFSPNERSKVYDAFEKYQTLKQERRQRDGVDRMYHLLRVIRADEHVQASIRDIFDELYVDEVQDLRSLDIELLFAIANHGRALNFAGDTAQTITQESHFRFEDLKTHIYEFFGSAATQMNQGDLARPKLFTLATNYRSHQGILGLAALIMELLWKGFPHSVDKLKPEVGTTWGPLPKFLLGCNPEMLKSKDQQSANDSQPTPAFGAQQAILVRDECTQQLLQDTLGNDALVLTIQQCKGMEFEDVLLWDFFTNTEYSSGWRAIQHLKTDARNFDAKAHAGMCLELKTFYVAVTRARLRLFILESETELSAHMLKALNEIASDLVVDACRSSDKNSKRIVDALRQTFYEPEQWIQKGREFERRADYELARVCYIRGGDEEGEQRASAHIYEAQGLFDDNSGRKAQAILQWRTALQLFQRLKSLPDACRVYEHLEEWAEAASICVQLGEFGRAAGHFEAARLFDRAADCHTSVGHYEEAANALRAGDLTNELVAHIQAHAHQIAPTSLDRYSRYCLLLIKRGKLKPEAISQAVKLFGSFERQESVFKAFKLWGELENLYTKQGDMRKIFLLRSKLGRLSEAFDLLKGFQELPSYESDFVSTVLDVVHYRCAGAIISPTEVSKPNLNFTYKPLSKLASTVGPVLAQWTAALRATDKKAPMSNVLAEVPQGVVKDFLSLHFLFRCNLISNALQATDLPFDAINMAIAMAKRATALRAGNHEPVVLLLAGVVNPGLADDEFAALPWSPLNPVSKTTNNEGLPQRAVSWFLRHFRIAIESFNQKAQYLWKRENPKRCINELTSETCRSKGPNGKCTLNHQRVSTEECQKRAQILLNVNVVFCEAMVLYVRRVMEDKFNSQILGIRRSWLEKLIQEVTFLSSVAHSSTVVAKLQTILSLEKAALVEGGKYRSLAPQIEDLLFYRLRNEWNAMSAISAIIDQMRLSRVLGSSVQTRFRRVAWGRLRSAGKTTTDCRDMMDVVRHLEQDIAKPEVGSFEKNVVRFRTMFLATSIEDVASFHAFTAVFELLATYLVLRLSHRAGGVVVPQSWIDLHFPRLAQFWANHASYASLEDDVLAYRNCLVGLAQDFACMLSTLTPQLMERVDRGFWLGNKTYSARLLHRRNCELLAVSLINLYSAGCNSGVLESLWKNVSVAFANDFLGASHLLYSSWNGSILLHKLVKSLGVYNGKDTIVLLRGASDHPFQTVLQKMGVESRQLDPVMRTALALRDSEREEPKASKSMALNQKTEDSANVSGGTAAIQQSEASKQVFTAQQKDTGEAEESDTEAEAARKIQRVWKTVARPRIRMKRDMAATAKGALVLDIIAVGRRLLFSGRHSRVLLLTAGIRLFERHGLLHARSEALLKRLNDELDKADNQRSYTQIDTVMGLGTGMGKISEILKGTDGTMTASNLTKLAAVDDTPQVTRLLAWVFAVHKSVEGFFTATERGLDELP